MAAAKSRGGDARDDAARGGDARDDAARGGDARPSVRSYVIRRGRITRAQQRALDELSGVYTVAAAETAVDWSAVFARRAPLWVEIGCGYGAATAQLAAANPACDCVAFEVHTPGVGALMNRLAAGDINNVRIVVADAMRYLARMFAAGSVSRLHIFFPDPWHKARHHKRRLVRAEMLPFFADCLACGGALHFVTDDANYAESAEALLSGSAFFCRGGVADDGADFPSHNADFPPQTEFARRAARAGRVVRSLVYRRRRRDLIDAATPR